MRTLRKRKMLDLSLVQDFHDDVLSGLNAALLEGIVHGGIIVPNVALSGTPTPVLHDLGRVPRVVMALGQATPASVGFTHHPAEPFRYVNVTAAAQPQVLNVQRVPATNVGLGAPETLHTFTVPANTLARDGDFIEAEYAMQGFGGIVSDCGVMFGASTLFVTSAAGASDSDIAVIRARVYRAGSAISSRAYATMVSSNVAWVTAAQGMVFPAENLAADVVIRSFGDDADGAVTCLQSTVTLYPGGSITTNLLIA